MSDLDVIRAWKDPAFRATLPPTLVPSHPAGFAEVADTDLKAASGYIPTQTTAMTCTEYTWRGWKPCCPK